MLLFFEEVRENQGNCVDIFQVGGITAILDIRHVHRIGYSAIGLARKQRIHKEGREKRQSQTLIPQNPCPLGNGIDESRRINERNPCPQDQIPEEIGVLRNGPETDIAKATRVRFLKCPLLIIRQSFDDQAGGVDGCAEGGAERIPRMRDSGAEGVGQGAYNRPQRGEDPKPGCNDGCAKIERLRLEREKGERHSLAPDGVDRRSSNRASRFVLLTLIRRKADSFIPQRITAQLDSLARRGDDFRRREGRAARVNALLPRKSRWR